MADFTYQPPSPQNFMRALRAYLERKNMASISNALADATCEFSTSGQFSRRRWDAYTAEFRLSVSLDRIDTFTQAVENQLLAAVSAVLPPNVGYDISTVTILPRFDDEVVVSQPTPSLDPFFFEDDALPSGRAAEPAQRTVGGAIELRLRLGEGGFGEVWRGVLTEENRDVAVKLPKSGVIQAVEALKKEAICLARLQHPSFPSFISCSFLSGREYIAMEFIDGKRCSEWLTSRPSLRSRVSVLVAISEALESAHTVSRIFHRDLKLENIMIDGASRPRVLDFGVAKTSLNEEQTREPRHVANVRNAPPECLNHVLERLPGPVPYAGPQEVWALGCMAWQMVVGTHPFEEPGDVTSTIAKIRVREMAGDAGQGGALLDFITAMLAMSPDERPTISAIAQNLRSLAPTLS